MQSSLERNQAFAFALLIGALVLLGLSTAGLEGQHLTMGDSGRRAPLETEAAVDQYGSLFTTEPFAKLSGGESRRDVFATTHFNRPPAPSAEPAAPKTRVVALTYLGILSGSGGASSAFLRVDQTVLKLTPGSSVVHDWKVGAVDGGRLVLTNATQTNQVDFRQTLQLTVPLP